MGFLDLLKEAKEKAKEEINNKITSDLNLSDLNKNILEDFKNSTEIKSDTSSDVIEEIIVELDEQINKKENNLASQIIINTINALELSKKLKPTNSAKRLAKSIISGRIDNYQMLKCFDLIKNRKPAHIDTKLVGGDAMIQLMNYYTTGFPIDIALKMKYIKKEL